MRIYLDFDGVMSPLKPFSGDCTTVTLQDGEHSVPTHVANFARDISNHPDTELIFISHREDEVERIADTLGIRQAKYLTFDDPTGSKVGRLLDPNVYAGLVIDDELTAQEVGMLSFKHQVLVPDGRRGLTWDDLDFLAKHGFKF